MIYCFIKKLVYKGEFEIVKKILQKHVKYFIKEYVVGGVGFNPSTVKHNLSLVLEQFYRIIKLNNF